MSNTNTSPYMEEAIRYAEDNRGEWIHAGRYTSAFEILFKNFTLNRRPATMTETGMYRYMLPNKKEKEKKL